MISGEKGMVAQIVLNKGVLVPLHAHPNEQFTIILSGALKFWLGPDEDRTQVVRGGEVLHIPGHLPHKAEALEDTVSFDVFVPPREDWLNKTDDYLRGGS
jgi:quercetin dioxygenase-like cupin family protein